MSMNIEILTSFTDPIPIFPTISSLQTILL